MLDQQIQNASNLPGQLVWIGVRPARQSPMQNVDAVQVRAGRGIVGDRYSTLQGARQVTLFQWEHLRLIAQRLGVEQVAPEGLRRNLAINDVDLLELQGNTFYLGSVLLEFSGLCLPCHAMERRLGPGGLKAMAGCGGITARILTSGVLRLGDRLIRG